VEAKPGPAARVEPAAQRGLEDAVEPETVAQLGLVVPDRSVAPVPAAAAARALRAWADQEWAARGRPVTEDLGAREDLEAGERERAEEEPPAAVMVGQAVAPAREVPAAAAVVLVRPDRSCRIAPV
jgi:hypothetical protein